jgi:hypothetical protein
MASAWPALYITSSVCPCVVKVSEGSVGDKAHVQIKKRAQLLREIALFVVWPPAKAMVSFIPSMETS